MKLVASAAAAPLSSGNTDNPGGNGGDTWFCNSTANCASMAGTAFYPERNMGRRYSNPHAGGLAGATGISMQEVQLQHMLVG